MIKIISIKTYVLEVKLSNPFSFSQWCYDVRTTCLVEIETSSGITGWGECYGPSKIISTIVDEMGKYLIGEDASDIERHWEYLYNRYRDYGQKGLLIEAISGIDIALWDILGKDLNRPICKLLGGVFRKEVQAYATGFYPISDDPIKQFEREAQSYLDAGFTAMKMKVGFGVEKDYKYIKAIKNIISDKAVLMIDANHAYDSVEAIKLGKKIENLNIGWFEEPVVPEDIEGYMECKRSLNIPIAGGECEFTRFGFKDILSRRSLDIIQPDVCSTGGISEAKKISIMANAYGVRYNPHGWGTGVGLSATLQILGNLAHSPLSLNPLNPMLELDQTEYPIRMEIVEEPILHKKGIVEIPMKAGLGIEINRKVLQKYSVS